MTSDVLALLIRIAVVLFALAWTADAAERCVPPRDDTGKILRSRAAIRHYRRLNPCPATGKVTGACRGYVIDHVWPLCACGRDHASNMAWMRDDQAKVKDQWERELCRAHRSPERETGDDSDERIER